MSLRLEAVGLHFAGVAALDDVTLELHAGEVLALLGPNGAGKSSLVNVATGVVAPASGRVLVDGRELQRPGPRRFAAAGVGRTFQSGRPFSSLTVLDDVRVGARGSRRLPLLGGVLPSPGQRRSEATLTRSAREALAALGVAHLAGLRGDRLSVGQRRRVELARVLASPARYLVLDEPGAGLDVPARAALVRTLRACTTAGRGVLLVEHDHDLVRDAADRVAGLVAGRLVAVGSYADVVAVPEIRRTT